MQSLINQLDQINTQQSVIDEMFECEILSPNLKGCVNL